MDYVSQTFLIAVLAFKLSGAIFLAERLSVAVWNHLQGVHVAYIRQGDEWLNRPNQIIMAVRTQRLIEQLHRNHGLVLHLISNNECCSCAYHQQHDRSQNCSVYFHIVINRIGSTRMIQYH